MLPISAKAEPNDFDITIRQPGNIFLAAVPNPTQTDWRGKEYWQKALPSLRSLNNKLCSYSSTWIPHGTGSHSVDHFIPKRINPTLAYEWSNFRYVSTRFNSRKGINTIIDPQEMLFNWFIIDFNTLFIEPNVAQLDAAQLALAVATIQILKFNDDDELVDERFCYYKDYIEQNITYDYLLRVAPFIAHEIERQNLKVA